MKRMIWLALGLLWLACDSSCAWAHIIPRPGRFTRINRELFGQVVDHTANHGRDRRIWSSALCQKRDLYVYLPPGYCPCKRYPLAMYLHGFQEDENGFVDNVVKPLDRAIACGKLPPIIIAAPDASPRGLNCLISYGTFYTNSNLGAFEDFFIKDVYSFVLRNYPIRPERQAHVLLGVSMGGAAAYNKAMKFRDDFGVAVGIFPPLNPRWISCRGHYFDNFDPNCWCWREDFSNGREPIGIFLHGLAKIRLGRMVYPLYGRDNNTILESISRESPIEMLDRLDIKPGEFEFYVGYGGEDEFNLDAQVESFLFRARQKGIEITSEYIPNGRHDVKSALRLLPGVIEWLRPRLQPYRPK